MKTTIEIKSIFGNVLFSHEKEDNTIKDTLEEAVKVRANLGWANLGGAYLERANLEGANLEGANLIGAYLIGAYLGDWGELGNCEDVLCVSPIGSRNGVTTIFHTDKGIFVRCGCFSGTLDEFVEKVKETHGDNKHAKNYLALVEFVKKKYNT